jgi:hypothetical protein
MKPRMSHLDFSTGMNQSAFAVAFARWEEDLRTPNRSGP